MQACDAMALSRAMVESLARQLHAQVIETHISWVILCADTAYKIKKPVHLPFVNYSTPEARRHFCEEEVRLNRRLAPSIYLGVARITGTYSAPSIDGPGPVLEHAVRMRRFPQEALFSERLATGALAANEVDDLAILLADFHEHAAPVTGDFGTAQQRSAAALAAMDGARPAAGTLDIAPLADWLRAQAQALTPLWAARASSGRIRQCHGDLHLDNIISQDGAVAAFDCIEFDPLLRCIDVLDDIAFAVMDFAARGRRDFAFRLLNAWLDRTGDHAALPALRFSSAYRALVRAQVAHLRNAADPTPTRRYLQAALSWMQMGPAHLYITHGLPGSGKTHVSQRLLEHEGAIRLRSDVERKRLFGLRMLDDSAAQGLNLYTAQVTAQTYSHLFATAAPALSAGLPVVLDAAFLQRGERDQARALAAQLGVGFSIVHCAAPLAVLRERLLARKGDASEANALVLEKLHASAQGLYEDERELIDTHWP